MPVSGMKVWHQKLSVASQVSAGNPQSSRQATGIAAKPCCLYAATRSLGSFRTLSRHDPGSERALNRDNMFRCHGVLLDGISRMIFYSHLVLLLVMDMRGSHDAGRQRKRNDMQRQYGARCSTAALSKHRQLDAYSFVSLHSGSVYTISSKSDVYVISLS